MICPQFHRSASGSPCVPLARPESSIDDSDLEDSGGSSRISTTWKDFTLPPVDQSIDSLTLSRSQCDGLLSPVTSSCTTPTLSTSSDQQSILTKPPPKPPRTFVGDNQKDWSLVNGTKSSLGNSCHLPSVDENSPLQSPERGPPKPPRTFEYVMIDAASYSYDKNNFLSSPDNWVLSPLEQNSQSNSIICTSFVDNSNPIKVNTKPCPSTVTYLQDRSCLTLCNGVYDHKPDNILNRSASYKSNSYSRCFSEERVNKPSRPTGKFQQKSFSLGRNADLKRDYKSEIMTSLSEQKVSLRQSRGNKNRSKRQARYWDDDETSRLLQFSSSCPDIPDTSVLQRTTQLNNGPLETWL